MLHLFPRLKYIFPGTFFPLLFTNLMLSYDPGQGLIRDCNTMSGLQFLPDSYYITLALAKQLPYDGEVLNVLCLSGTLGRFPAFYNSANCISRYFQSTAYLTQAHAFACHLQDYLPVCRGYHETSSLIVL